MEKELLEAFEAAKKAADGAAAGGGPAEEGRCVDALRQLRRVPVTKDLLMATKVGKCLRCLTKHPLGKIKAVASELFQFWRNLVLEEASKEKKNHNPQDRISKMVEVKSKRANTIGVNKGLDRVLKSASVKVGDIESEHGINDGGPHAKEKVNGIDNIVVQTVVEEEKEASVSSPLRPPKSMSTMKCNDPVRDKLRDILVEAFSRVSKETRESHREEVKNILNRVDACDPIHVAVSVECAMFTKLGPTSGAHKVRYRSIMFNLKDNKNTDLRRRVLLGRVLPEELVYMTPEEMASDERKLLNQQIKEKALFECERGGGSPEATTDQFKCGRCGQRKTTYYQMQTRSADEPMTTFVTCVNCNNHWKFC